MLFLHSAPCAVKIGLMVRIERCQLRWFPHQTRSKAARCCGIRRMGVYTPTYWEKMPILQASLQIVVFPQTGCLAASPAHYSHKKTPVPIQCWDKSKISCGATRLDAYLHPLIAYYHMLDLVTKFPLRLVYLRSAFNSPSEVHSTKLSTPLPTNRGSLW